MRVEDVTGTLDMALEASGCASASVKHRPRLLSDNGPSCIAEGLANYFEANSMSRVRGAPLHPQTQGQIEAFVEHYNHQRYHERLDNVTPADAYFGRAEAIIKQRERTKRKTIQHRR